MPATVVKLGPGTLTVGGPTTPALLDFTCQVTAGHVDWSVDEGDDVKVLCGETVPGARTYSAVIAGTVLSDLGATVGIIEYSWTNKGLQLPFVFVPSDVAAKQVSGTLIMDPLTVGGDEAGENMSSDFEWKIVGDPVLEAATVAARAEAVGTAKTPAKAAA